nr:MAG TPA: hypothetical protein [Caudoviricetes sp.]
MGKEISLPTLSQNIQTGTQQKSCLIILIEWLFCLQNLERK